jgi:hypothetical protein
MANPELLDKPKYASLRQFMSKLSKSPAFVSKSSAKKGLDESDEEDDDGSDKDCKIL